MLIFLGVKSSKNRVDPWFLFHSWVDLLSSGNDTFVNMCPSVFGYWFLVRVLS